MKQLIWCCVTSIIVALIVVFGVSRIIGHSEQASFLETQVTQKIAWMQNINTAGDDIRFVNLQIRQQCLNSKALSITQQNMLRMQARQKFLTASAGAGVIFDDTTLNDIKAFFSFDRSVDDVCAKSSPDDRKWLEYQTKISNDFKESIAADKVEIARLHGVTTS